MAKSPFADDSSSQSESSLLGDLGRKFGDLFNRGSGGLPQTQSRLSHALTIRAGQGRIVGAIYGWDLTQRRQIDEEFEVNTNRDGLPVDIVPQNLIERTIRITRVDLYTTLMEEAFGTRELVVLTQQTNPLSLREVWRGPSGVLTGGQRIYEYRNCWFADIGRSISAESDRVVRANATVIWGDRRRLL